MIYASTQDHFEIVKLLIQYGAKAIINYKNNNGFDAISGAKEKQYFHIEQFLIDILIEKD